MNKKNGSTSRRLKLVNEEVDKLGEDTSMYTGSASRPILVNELVGRLGGDMNKQTGSA